MFDQIFHFCGSFGGVHVDKIVFIRFPDRQFIKSVYTN